MPGAGPRPGPHAVRPLRRARHGRADAASTAASSTTARRCASSRCWSAARTFPGLNLTWEVREGMIKHRPDADATAPAEYAPGERADARGAAGRLRGRDRLQQPRHRRRPGVQMITVEDIRDVRLFREAHDAVLAEQRRRRAHRAPPGRAPHHRPLRVRPDRRRRCATLEGERVRSVEDVRARPRLVGYTPEMAEGVRELEGLPVQEPLPPLPRRAHGRQGRPHPARPVRTRTSASRCSSRPTTRRAPADGVDRVRLRLHRRHDRPLRARRAPQAVRPAGEGVTPSVITALLIYVRRVGRGRRCGSRRRVQQRRLLRRRPAAPGRMIFTTLLAADIGAGSTVGATGLAYRHGLSAWWWSGSRGDRLLAARAVRRAAPAPRWRPSARSSSRSATSSRRASTAPCAVSSA